MALLGAVLWASAAASSGYCEPVLADTFGALPSLGFASPSFSEASFPWIHSGTVWSPSGLKKIGSLTSLQMTACNITASCSSPWELVAGRIDAQVVVPFKKAAVGWSFDHTIGSLVPGFYVALHINSKAGDIAVVGGRDGVFLLLLAANETTATATRLPKTLASTALTLHLELVKVEESVMVFIDQSYTPQYSVATSLLDVSSARVSVYVFAASEAVSGLRAWRRQAIKNTPTNETTTNSKTETGTYSRTSTHTRTASGKPGSISYALLNLLEITQPDPNYGCFPGLDGCGKLWIDDFDCFLSDRFKILNTNSPTPWTSTTRFIENSLSLTDSKLYFHTMKCKHECHGREWIAGEVMLLDKVEYGSISIFSEISETPPGHFFCHYLGTQKYSNWRILERRNITCSSWFSHSHFSRCFAL
eukprot:TRINITY_DN1734_c0_g1_i1.p1 TRINITY_DN1734_c0_g1~~TRINITY_DN1734_c0_g1_i1.p1  ORF type:complete len:419 (-),score=65.27 TRINITY_DN1734_c0_g1_i1:929-2185(-)